uniref:Uncharacterized protein n=1 Tax=Cucumis melo TaxID=3656 RepID=A0A9I9DDN7_CUCME
MKERGGGGGAVQTTGHVEQSLMQSCPVEGTAIWALDDAEKKANATMQSPKEPRIRLVPGNGVDLE